MSSQPAVRVRFAPSPSGQLHLGNARTALYNRLFAGRKGGTFVLRIEDTDVERSSQESIESIIRDLRWMNVDWEEGPDKGGQYGPYCQSQRLSLYVDELEKLVAKDLAYPCFCTVEELEEKRRIASETGAMQKYDGTCAHLGAAEREKFIAEGRPYSWRFRMPERMVEVDDLIRGKVSFDTSLFGDIIIVRPSGMPSFHFAVAVDDMLMRISHVIRGEDHLTNTPKHIMLMEAMGAEIPAFAHMSMIMGPGKTKLSKRHGAMSIAQYRDTGYLPEGLANYIALLGWAPPEDKEILSFREMTEYFDIGRLGKSASIFDPEKLNWVSGQHIRAEDPSRITTLALGFFREAGLISGDVSEDRFEWLVRLVRLIRGYVSCLSELPEHARMFFADSVDYAALGEDAKASFSELGLVSMIEECIAFFEAEDELDSVDLGKLNKILKEKTGFAGRKFYMNLRIALTGDVHGPELPEVLALLGRRSVLARLEQARGFLSVS